MLLSQSVPHEFYIYLSQHCQSDCELVHRNALDGLIKIARTEGPAQLWRGTDLSLAVCVPAMAVYFPLYDYSLQHLQSSGGPDFDNLQIVEM